MAIANGDLRRDGRPEHPLHQSARVVRGHRAEDPPAARGARRPLGHVPRPGDDLRRRARARRAASRCSSSATAMRSPATCCDEQQLPELVAARSRADPQLRRERPVHPDRDDQALRRTRTRMSFDEAVHATRELAGRHDIDSVAVPHRRRRRTSRRSGRSRRHRRGRRPDRRGRARRIARRRRRALRPHARAADEPTARGGERPQQTYPPRVERWRSSLLDLSFRNPLLNMRTGRTSLDLHVPHGSLGTLEDLMFDGADAQRRSRTTSSRKSIAHAARGPRRTSSRRCSRTCSREEDRLRRDHRGRSTSRACAGSSAAREPSLEETGANNLFLTLGHARVGGRRAPGTCAAVPASR